MSRFRSSGSRLRKDASEGYRLQSDLIVQSAKKCMESKGVQRTTLVDVAREADMTRELIYYYFSGKQEIVDQVVESYVQDAVETARLWCETWDDISSGDESSLPREAYVNAVAAIRRFMRNSSGERRPMFKVLVEANRCKEFFSRACTSMVSELGSCGAAKKLNDAVFCAGQNRIKDALVFYLAGTIGLIESSNITDDEIVDLLCVLGGNR